MIETALSNKKSLFLEPFSSATASAPEHSLLTNVCAPKKAGKEGRLVYDASSLRFHWPVPISSRNTMTAMKLLSLVGAATASAGSSSLAAAASSPFSRRTISSSAVMTPASTTARTLTDASGGPYAYLDSLSGYSLKYSHCVRVKIPQYSDDDVVEGNVNFYNGR